MAKKWVTLDKKELDAMRELYFNIDGTYNSDKLTIYIKMLKRFEKQFKKINIQSAKKKGRNLQQWVCKKLAQITNVEYDQASDHSPIRSREMGQSGTDIILRGSALEKLPIAIECKSTESLNILETIDQAKENLKSPYKEWAVVHKRKSLSSPIVIIDWDFFEALLGCWKK